MLPPALQRHIEGALGSEVESTTTATGGFSPATRERILLRDGRRAFVKAGTDADTRAWLRDEWRVYGALSRPFLPEVLHWSDTEAVLVLEDLGDCERAPPWTGRAVAAVVATLAEVAATRPPPDVPALDPSPFRGWQRSLWSLQSIATLGAATPEWLQSHGPVLARAEAAARISGDSLLHCDVRGDNLFLRGGRAILVDWNWSVRGNAAVDRAFWAPSLQLDGGPPPEQVVGHEPELAAAVAGFFAYQAVQPIEQATPAIRAFQVAQLRQALPWAARALGLPLEGVTTAQAASGHGMSL